MPCRNGSIIVILTCFEAALQGNRFREGIMVSASLVCDDSR